MRGVKKIPSFCSEQAVQSRLNMVRLPRRSATRNDLLSSNFGTKPKIEANNE